MPIIKTNTGEIEITKLTQQQENQRNDFFLRLPTANLQSKILMAKNVIDTHTDIAVSISGGADSDCLLDWMWHLDVQKKCRYFFINTGLEMQATKNHIEYLQNRYEIQIQTVKPKITTAASVQQHGYPFLSKQISENIYRLQRDNFDFKDEPYNVLCQKHPNITSAIRWWCNCKKTQEEHKPLTSEIGSTKYLKEFLILNPPQFLISKRCCDDSKKNPAHKAQKGSDLVCTGIRLAEGGTRTMAYKTCFTEKRKYTWDTYTPLLFWSDKDKELYEKEFNIQHSEAYTKYGFKRTGCAGCPYNSHCSQDLKSLDQFEPKLANAVRNIFKPSYEYTQQYREFKEFMKTKEKLQIA